MSEKSQQADILVSFKIRGKNKTMNLCFKKSE